MPRDSEHRFYPFLVSTVDNQARPRLIINAALVGLHPIANAAFPEHYDGVMPDSPM